MNKLFIAGIVVVISILIAFGYYFITHPEVENTNSLNFQGTQGQTNQAQGTAQGTAGNTTSPSLNIYSDNFDDDEEDD